MSLLPEFDRAAAARAETATSAPRTKRRPAPFSLRLTAEERARLTEEAGGAPLGAYIKSKVLGRPLRIRRKDWLPVKDRVSVAALLGLLGRSHIASNLNQLAKAANTGSLPLTPETEAELLAALDDVRAMRTILTIALGLKPGFTR